MAFAYEVAGTERNRPTKETAGLRAGAQTLITWCVMAPSSATASRPWTIRRTVNIGPPLLGPRGCALQPARASVARYNASMKITAIDSYVLTVPTPQPMARSYPHQKLVVADISTDEGAKGLGYSLVFGGGGAEAILAYLRGRLAPLLIGEDPLMVGRLWEKMFRADMGIKKQGVAAYALSALDIGLWDIAGKAAGLPLYRMWGAVADRIPAYGSGGWSKYSEAELIAEAERYAKQGCRYYKMKIHHADPLENRKRVEAVQRALGGK